MSDFNWVKAQAEWLPAKALEYLFELIKGDVDDVKGLKLDRVFDAQFDSIHQRIIVSRGSNYVAPSGVILELVPGKGIRASGKTSEGKLWLDFIGTPHLNEKGERGFLVDKEFLNLWQFRQRALASFFFD